MEAATQSYHPALTDPGMIMGTVGYMSPEQVRGQQVDTRSDLFSLGCVLYEMVTGQRAFARDTTADTLAAILYDDLPEQIGSGKWMPPELDRIIRHCLEKSPEERFHSARDLAFALRAIADDSTPSTPTRSASARRIHPAAWMVVTVVPLGLLLAVPFLLLGPSREKGSDSAPKVRNTIRSLAVLPFVYQEGDADAEFLGDGVPMSLISSLARVGELQVRPFGSVSSYRGATASDPAGVGKKLGVQTVLTGTVRIRGDELFISCELVDVQTNSVLPSGEPYRRKLKDLFAVQEELAHAIADQLRLQLSGEARRELAKRPTENREAYRLYILGRREAEQRTAAGLSKSIDHYKLAIQKDPNYALAYSGIADSYIQLGLDSLSPNEAFKAAKDHAEKAIQRDPALAEARVSLGTCYLLYDWDWAAARRELDLAITYDKNYADAYHFYSHYFQIMGSTADGIAMMKRAEGIDPTSAVFKTELAWAYYAHRDYDQAIREYLEMRTMDPNYVWVIPYLAQAYEQYSMNKEAIDELKMLRDREKNWPAVVVELGYAYAASGQKDELRIILKELKELSAHRYISPYYMAAIFVARGEHDEAIKWLRTAVDERDPNIPFLKVEPKFDGLRSDPRYAEVLRSIGIPQ